MAFTGFDMHEMMWEELGNGIVQCRTPLAIGIGSSRELALANWKQGAQRAKDRQRAAEIKPVKPAAD